MKRAVIVIVAATALALSTAGTGGALAAASHERATTVRVMLAEFTLTPSTRRVAAGPVTFVAMNMGSLHHELVVLRTPKLSGKLPVKGMAASEAGRVGEIAALNPGRTGRITLNLKPGHYVLICNIPGHYKAGQHADLVVR